MIEQELKFMLDQKGWSAILDFARKEGLLLSTASQTNTYFDFEGLPLSRGRVTLRVRAKSGRFELTCKELIDPGSDAQRCLETNASIIKEEAESFLASPEVLSGRDLPPIRALHRIMGERGIPDGVLCVVGELTTERAKIQSPSGRWILELDRSHYAGREDFELECETEDPLEARAELDELFARLGVVSRASALPKFARLMNALGLSV